MKEVEGLFEKAINQSNYRAIFENQREKLIEVLNGDMLYPYNGGYFLLSPTLFLEVKMLVDEGKSSSILLDMNKNPIRIDDLNIFLSTTRTLYSEAINKYSMGLARLKKSRMISTVTKVHDLEDDVEQ